MTNRPHILPISASDAFHLDVPNDHVGCLWLLDTPVEPGALVAAAARLMAVVPRMSSVYDGELGAWRGEFESDPADQIIRCPPAQSEEAMLTELAVRYVEPLLGPRPPWRAIHLPFSSRNGPKEALCFLAHHAFLDGMRGFLMARAFASGTAGREASATSAVGGLGLAAAATAAAMSAWEMLRRPARAVPKHLDSGARSFAYGSIPATTLRSVTRAAGLGRTDLLARAFAAALAERFDAPFVRLMIPRDVGSIGGHTGGNAFLPEFRSFVRTADGVCEEARNGGSVDLRAAADQWRMRLMRRMPLTLRRVGYHRWADGFDALCTILPDLFHGQTIGAAAVRQAFGVPPLIWRQPISCAFIAGSAGANMLVAWDPAALDGSDLIGATLRHVTTLAAPRA